MLCLCVLVMFVSLCVGDVCVSVLVMLCLCVVMLCLCVGDVCVSVLVMFVSLCW